MRERLVRRRDDEAGVVGGLEVLPFGFLVFVVGTLLLVNAWGVLDAKLAVTAAAREAARAFVESDAGSTEAALADARAAAAAALEGHGRDAGRLELLEEPPALVRCAPATFAVGYRVPTISLPWIGGFGGGFIRTVGRHTEIVDPYRDGVPSAGEAHRCG